MPSIGSRRALGVGLLLVVVMVALLSVPLAERGAVRAEESHVAERLKSAPCLTDWGVNEGAATGDVAVTGVTAGGLRVSVTLPYAYTTERDGEEIFADTASEATYVVGPLGARRVAGDEVSPC